MARAELTIDLDAIVDNWRALDRLSARHVETAPVLKADAYGLGASEVAPALYRAGARSFFVALAEEGAEIRKATSRDASIYVLSGHMDGDADILSEYRLYPALNSIPQWRRHLAESPDLPFAIQIETGMNRLGMSQGDTIEIRSWLRRHPPRFVMSHLACADEPDHPLNAQQREVFEHLTKGMDAWLSLAATGGVLLGSSYHFDICRTGIGMFGGLPFANARPVVNLDLPVIQVHEIPVGATVGYGASWRATSPSRIATVAAGYADGILRMAGNKASLFANGVPCPLAGRVSMDLLTVDVTHLQQVPDTLQLLGKDQTVDELAGHAETVGYEILTSLGSRYRRVYKRSQAAR